MSQSKSRLIILLILSFVAVLINIIVIVTGSNGTIYHGISNITISQENAST